MIKKREKQNEVQERVRMKIVSDMKYTRLLTSITNIAENKNIGHFLIFSLIV